MGKKPWRDWTEKEINKYKETVCRKCHYSLATDKKYTAFMTCGYILEEYKSRGCTPDECKAKGIFRPKEEKKRKRWEQT